MLTVAKALPLSGALTLILAYMLSPNGSYAVFMHIAPMHIGYFSFYWSWPIFAILTLFAWIFFLMLEIR